MNHRCVKEYKYVKVSSTERLTECFVSSVTFCEKSIVFLLSRDEVENCIITMSCVSVLYTACVWILMNKNVEFKLHLQTITEMIKGMEICTENNGENREIRSSLL